MDPRGDGRPSVVSSLLQGIATVGVIGFGGGSALIPVIDKELVQNRGLLDDSTYTRHTIVANITPGALPVKLAAAAGLTVRGPLVAVVAALLMAMPGVVGTLGLMAASAALGPAAVRAITYASVGIAAFIIVLLIGYILKVHAQAGSRVWAYVAITVVSALATGGTAIVTLLAALLGVPLSLHLPRLSAVQLIVVALLVIVVVAVVGSRIKGQGSSVRRQQQQRNLAPTWRSTALFAALAAAGIGVFAMMAGGKGLELGALLALSAVTSFGGGEAYIGVADGFFVQEGLVGREVFYTQLVPIANALPGPILVKVGAGVGYLAGAEVSVARALTLGAAAMAITVGACCAVAMPVLGLYEELKDHAVVRSIGTYILPVICGLLIAVAATMLEVSAAVAVDTRVGPTVVLWASIAAIAVMTWLHVGKRVPDLAMLAVAGLLSLGALSWW